MSCNAKNYTEQGGDVTHIGGKLIIEEGAVVEGLPSQGKGAAYTLPAASENALGGVKQCQCQVPSNAGKLSELVADFNSLLAALKAAGIMHANE